VETAIGTQSLEITNTKAKALIAWEKINKTGIIDQTDHDKS